MSGELPSREPETDRSKLVRPLERGRIAFVVRPRVEGAAGLQRFLFVLSPEDRDVHRRVVVGRKRMPAPGAKEREWAYVEMLAASRRQFLGDLGPKTYRTKTRGLRHQPGARIIAEGHYAILEHAEHTHLTYALDPDSERDALHDAVNVAKEGSVIAAVFNPLVRWPRRSRQLALKYAGDAEDDAPFHEPSIYPDELQARFGEKRFVPLEPEFLDYEGSELVLIGAEDAVRWELAVAV